MPLDLAEAISELEAAPLVDVLVLVLHGGAHGRVSHNIHDRKQVFGCAIHLRSEEADLQVPLPGDRISSLRKG